MLLAYSLVQPVRVESHLRPAAAGFGSEVTRKPRRLDGSHAQLEYLVGVALHFLHIVDLQCLKVLLINPAIRQALQHHAPAA